MPSPGGSPSADQSAAGGVFGVDLRQFLFTVDIGLVDGLHPSAAGVAAAAAAVTQAAAGIQRPPHDLLPLGAGGVPDQQGSHRSHLPSRGHTQHIFHQDAVAPGGIVDEHMGHSAHEFAVL